METAETVSPSGVVATGVQMQADVIDIRRSGLNEQHYQADANADTKSAGNRRESGKETSNTVVITYNQQARESVIKFLDGEGNIVSQSPPRMYLKTMESSNSRKSEDPGNLLNKVA
jgi:hypothetical protein